MSCFFEDYNHTCSERREIDQKRKKNLWKAKFGIKDVMYSIIAIYNHIPTYFQIYLEESTDNAINGTWLVDM